MSFRVIINQTGKMRHQLEREKIGEREDHREGSGRERGRLNVTKLVSDSNSDFHLDCGSQSPAMLCQLHELHSSRCANQFGNRN